MTQIYKVGHSVKVLTNKVDVIGDVHGCLVELKKLIKQLGYIKDKNSYYHPKGRILLFVGDLVDRGPDSLGVLNLVRKMVKHKRAVCALGNHDDKIKRYLKGNRIKISGSIKTTIAELKNSTTKEKESILAFLEKCPLYIQADIDDKSKTHLIIAHAAWKPKIFTADSKYARNYCVFGPVTGKKTPDGFFERVDWTEFYPVDTGPTVVTGHTSYIGPIADRNKCICIDTACVYGGYLTALRWPSKEIVQVKAKKEYVLKEGIGDKPRLVSQKNRTRKMDLDPICSNKDSFSLHLKDIYKSLSLNGKTVLATIFNDSLLLKREQELSNGKLILANASSKLFTPEEQHHLYAKGIVFFWKDDEYTLVSLPYVKMYNYGEREEATALANKLFEDPNITVVFNEKLDGTMIQTFSTAKIESEPKVLITTRGMIEGAPVPNLDTHFDYLGTARALLEQQSPWALDPILTKDRTYLWELIHPEAKIITDYGQEQKIVLTGAVDYSYRQPRYLTRKELEELSLNTNTALSKKYTLKGKTLYEKLKNLQADLQGTDLEGSVLTFESKEVLHRIKVKGDDYIKLVRISRYCTYANTVAMIEEFKSVGEGVSSWEDLQTLLMKRGSNLVPEETLVFYKQYYEQYSEYIASTQKIFDLVRELYIDVEKECGIADGTPEWRRRLAAFLFGNFPNMAGFMFSFVDGKLNQFFIDNKFKHSQESLDSFLASYQRRRQDYAIKQKS